MIMNMISVLISCRRKVVEHICLLKAKEGLSEEEENDMLDYLYTTQYQMGGIIAISLGKVYDSLTFSTLTLRTFTLLLGEINVSHTLTHIELGLT
jgi:hypothetical protein